MRTAPPPLPVRSASTEKKSARVTTLARPPPPPPPKQVLCIQINSTTATDLPWTFAPNQWALKINNTLYLLAIETDSMGTKRSVHLFFTRFEERHYDYTVLDCVGRTKYSVEMLCGLSQSAIQSYDSYEYIWRNCQAFLNHYLDLITEGRHKSINTPSSILRTTAFATTFGPGSIPSPLPQIKSKWDINENETRVARIATF